MELVLSLNESEVRLAVADSIARRQGVPVEAVSVALSVDPGDPGHYADTGPKIRARVMLPTPPEGSDG